MKLFIKTEKYLTDPNGKPSSKRLMQVRTLNFFFAFNTMIWPLFLYWTIGRAPLVINGIMYPQSNVDINWLMAILALDLLTLTAAFVPAGLSKLSETKEIIALGGRKPMGQETMDDEPPVYGSIVNPNKQAKR